MLEDHRIGCLPELFYIPEYVSKDDEERLCQAIRGSKAPWIKAGSRSFCKNALFSPALASWAYVEGLTVSFAFTYESNGIENTS
jgi:hypothetical protein